MSWTPNVVPEDHVIVVFGATGDLARRKLLPALYHLAAEGLMPRRYRIIGVSRSPMHDADFRNLVRESVDIHCRCDRAAAAWESFAKNLSSVADDFGPDSTATLRSAVDAADADLGEDSRRLFYLAVPPTAFGPITAGVGAAGLSERARVIYEKPYGTDLDSFAALDRLVHGVLGERQVYRIDHFLGKETVQNILALRFANGMFEPIWNRNHIDHVQIDVPEELGVGTRAQFYDKTGALKDMIVTHLFQVLGFVAMEPPASFEEKALIDEQVKVFEAMSPLTPSDVVRGQYDGYRDIDGVSPNSDTETFAAARVFIDNWRWSGVPFYLRTGKRMAERRSTVVLAFRPPPRQMFKRLSGDRFAHDQLALELGPNEGISATFLAKVPGPTTELAPVHMDFRYDGSFGSELIEAYERLIHDALIGDRRLFTRADGIKRTWELVAEVLDGPPTLHPYLQGSWGPAEADGLIAPRRWHLPPGRSEIDSVVAPPPSIPRDVEPPRSRVATGGPTRPTRKRLLQRDAREKVLDRA
jgi:glucose-6-phosphate 1-dehydrogenase